MKEDKKTENSKKGKLALKIIIPVIIVGIIVMIAFVKNTPEMPAVETNPVATSQTAEKGAGQSVRTDSADFDLLTSEVDLEKLKSYGLPMIIDFGSDECIPCKEMAPVLKKMNEEWRGKVIVKFVDVWKYTDASANFPVTLIPTQVIFDANGKPFVPSEKLMSEIPFNQYTLKNSEEHVFTTHEGGLTEEQFRAIFAEMGVSK